MKVGSGGFSSGVVWFTSLAFGPSGQPYVAYRDEEQNSKATVMKFDGTNWVGVGIAQFSAAPIWYVSLAFSPSGQPYVAYSDEGNSFKATVMMFDGTAWQNVGSPGFSAGEAFYTSIAFSQLGQPYVVYTDYGFSQKASVMFFGEPAGIDKLENYYFSIYPNPASTLLKVDMRGVAHEMKYIEVYDMTGKKMFETITSDNKVVLNVENYPDGFYFIRLKSDSLNYTGKFCKK
jgi:hypothetical protein